VLKPGAIAIDLGANEGFHTRDFSERVGPTGLVHAFEPNPSMWPNLFAVPQVRLWPVAVGDANSVESFFLPAEQFHHQVGSLVDPRDFMGDVPVRILTVPQVTLDSLTELGEQKVSFIKADVERRELHAFRGSVEFLNRHQPVIVYENNKPEIEALLSSLCYKVYPMAMCLRPDSLANSVAVPRALHDNPTAAVLNDEEFHRLATWVEGQYPDDVI
jgi:FkbM family methyltransferase